MRESAIEAACVKLAVKRGCISLKQQGGDAGTPDRVFLLPGGRVLVVEFKTITGRLSPRQQIVFERYGALGHPVFIIRQRSMMKLLLDSVLGPAVD